MVDSNIYTVGGTVQANQGGIYIPRKADEELLSLCRERKFAYVLTPRQMGKSSLMVGTASRLKSEGIQSVVIDLTKIGVHVATAEQWFLGLLTEIEMQLMLNTDVIQWWEGYTHLSFTQRFTEFFHQVLLTELTTPVVIFIDEIDTTLSLNFADDFFAVIRYLYISRAFYSKFEQFSFVLIGTATPSDLIRDPMRTPFNIGQRVDLTDFTFEEAKPLAKGLGLPTLKAYQVLQWVLDWTGGHPYLTQRLCSVISRQDTRSSSKADIDCIVRNTFLGAMSEQDNNLQFVRDMLTKRAPDKESVLRVYREILRRKRPVFDEEQSFIKSHLKLSGVARCDNGRLCVRNSIYQEVFNDKWIKENIPVSKKFPLWQILLGQVLTSSAGLAVIFIRFFGVLQPLELKAFDILMQLRPDEGIDKRLLIVKITDEDILAQDKRGERGQGSLREPSVKSLLATLEQHKPRLIGLALYRPFSADPSIPGLLKLLQQKNFFTVCKVPTLEEERNSHPEVAPPLEVSPQNIGFSDFVSDTDGTVRRHLMLQDQVAGTTCRTQQSFSLLLARRYLEQELPKSTHYQDPLQSGNELKLGRIVFHRLQYFTGGYQDVDARGYQILLNYRATSSGKIAQELTVEDILNKRFRDADIRGKIVLIGSDAEQQGASDHWATPYGTVNGVIIHAHMISQILSAVLDRRPLLSVLPQGIEILWIWGWSLAGSILAWRSRSLLSLILFGGIVLAILCISCFIVLSILSTWIPLIPPILGFIIASIGVLPYLKLLEEQPGRLKLSKSLLDRFNDICYSKGEKATDVVVKFMTAYIEQHKSSFNTTNTNSNKDKKKTDK